MLFVLVMEVLNALIQRAEQLNLFTPLGPSTIKRRAFLYADDMVVFLHPLEHDLQLMRSVLDLFAAAVRPPHEHTKMSILTNPLH